MRILIVDDNATSLESLRTVLEDLGHQATAVPHPHRAIEEAARTFYPLIITDIRMPDMDGLELLAHLKSDTATAKSNVVLITGHGDMETAVEALRRGAYDYLNKPINARELAIVVDRCAEHMALVSENATLRSDMEGRVAQATTALRQDLEAARLRLRNVSGIGDIVTASPAMRRILEEAAIFHADTSVPVLVEGETGTGKEVVARLVHFGHDGDDRPFIDLNCAAIPTELFESELFGHEAGAYTGSRSGGSPGKLELAADGTLFLDEVAELPLHLQPKLLRVLEERTFYRLGGLKRRNFRARIVCAANRDLEQMVENGLFRRDLYHRLRVGHLILPPLRERREDIPEMAALFLRREAARKKKQFTGIDDEALALLQSAVWKGNVRELENTIERAVLLHDGTLLRPEHLVLPIRLSDDVSHRTGSEGTPANEALTSTPEDFRIPDEGMNLHEFVERLVEQALQRCNGNKTRAATLLGLSRFALLRRLRK